jgi:uncharacterized membrane protein YphA (DoxX/SURF4 family)
MSLTVVRLARPTFAGLGSGYAWTVTIAEALARPLLAGAFIYGGIDSLRNADSKSKIAEPVLGPLSDLTGLDAPTLVRVNAGVQVAAGACLALGILPRPAAAVLAVSLIPTTLGGHRPWEHDDPAARTNHINHLLKNAGLLGGLVLAAASHGSRPSFPWMARRAAHQVAESSASTIEHLTHRG